MMARQIARVGAALSAGLAVSCGSLEPANDVSGVIPSQGALLAASCSGCHAETDGSVSDLKGQSASAIRTWLLTYKNAQEGTTVMHRLARGYSDREIELVAGYLASESDGT